MNKYLLQQIGMLAVGLVLAGLHMWVHDFSVSFFILPVTLSVAMAYMYANEYLVLPFVVLAEMFSSFPPGVLTAVILLPWAVRRLLPTIEVGMAGTFFQLILATVGLQMLVLSLVPIVMSAWQMGFSWHTVWYSFPLRPFVAGWAGSSVLMFILIIAWKGAGLTAYAPAKLRGS